MDVTTIFSRMELAVRVCHPLSHRVKKLTASQAEEGLKKKRVRTEKLKSAFLRDVIKADKTKVQKEKSVS